jgi:hypothetical protein
MRGECVAADRRACGSGGGGGGGAVYNPSLIVSRDIYIVIVLKALGSQLLEKALV